MASRFADHPEAVRETLLLAERLTFDLAGTSATAIPGPRSRAPSGAWPSCAARACEDRYGDVRRTPRARRRRAWSRSCA